MAQPTGRNAFFPYPLADYSEALPEKGPFKKLGWQTLLNNQADTQYRPVILNIIEKEGHEEQNIHLAQLNAALHTTRGWRLVPGLVGGLESPRPMRRVIS